MLFPFAIGAELRAELDEAVCAVGGAHDRVDGVVRREVLLVLRRVGGERDELAWEDDAQRGDRVLGDATESARMQRNRRCEDTYDATVQLAEGHTRLVPGRM